jgi:D-alanyl-D-alanine dipeptidase
MGSVQSLLAAGEFVEIGGRPGIVPDLRYATASNFTGAVVHGAFERALLHKDAAAKLERAVATLRERAPDHSLLIYDALRPRSVQWLLWNHVKGTAQEPYVAEPRRGSIHNYGMAVDLTIVDGQGRELDMGSYFDDFSEQAEPRHEPELLRTGKLTKAQLANRLQLRHLMEGAGFIQMPHEWWHYDAMTRAQVEAGYRIVE